MDYFMQYKDENILEIFFDLNKVQYGVYIYFEEKNKVLSRRLKTNILNFRQNIYSEKEENKHCKNYPFNGSASFGDCDKKYLYDKFVNFFKIMPFWVALNLSEVTNYRLVHQIPISY